VLHTYPVSHLDFFARASMRHLHQAETCRTRCSVDDRNINVLTSIPHEVRSKAAWTSQSHFDLIHPDADSRMEAFKKSSESRDR
jgi:hypothetical protein